MAGMGYAVMGAATASGTRRAIEAAQKAIASPLLEAGAIDGARGILINITGSASLKLAEVQEACTIIQNAAHEDANIIFGAVLDDKMKDAVKITVIATGFKNGEGIRRRAMETTETYVQFSGSRARNVNVEDDFAEMEPAPPSRPMVMEQAAPGAEPININNDNGVISLDTMRNAMIGANFEQEDLDVPAFLRKRGDVI
jgi:cell division protein FtsZ